MRAFLEKYGTAIFVLVLMALLITIGPVLANEVGNKVTEEVSNLPNGKQELVAGTYDADWNLLQTWDDLGINIEEDLSYSSANTTVAKLGDAKKLVIPEGVTKIGDYQLYGASQLDEITIPDSVTSIGSYVFFSYTGTSINIPESVTSIGQSAFSGCSSLTSITIPDGVTSIRSGTFGGCSSLTSITIPDGVTSIGSGAFSGCSSLTSITIPDGVTSIGNYAFNSCSNLTTIHYSGTAAGAPWGATNATVEP